MIIGQSQLLVFKDLDHFKGLGGHGMERGHHSALFVVISIVVPSLINANSISLSLFADTYLRHSLYFFYYIYIFILLILFTYLYYYLYYNKNVNYIYLLFIFQKLKLIIFTDNI